MIQKRRSKNFTTISPAMKRRRKSTTKHTHQEQTQQEESIEEEKDVVQVPPGASISDVPGPILIDIFSRLSVKSIFRCRCVCKFWLKLLLDPDFAKLHFSRAPTCPLLRDSGERRLSKALYLVELERDSIADVCDKSCDIKECFRECDRHVNMKLSTVFMLPERESSSRTKIRERRFDIVNSCNGLLCLRGSLNNYPIVIYNPVTGEYLVLPKPEEDDELTFYLDVGGLGFCPKTNQYKVLMIICKKICNPAKWTLIYTLGSGKWRRSGNAPYFHIGTTCHAYLNGALHWLVGTNTCKFIVSFNFESEQFRALPSPPRFFPRNNVDNLLPYKHTPGMPHYVSKMTIGVIGSRLYLCDASNYHPVNIWVMKKYGVKGSWVKRYKIDTDGGERWPVGLCQPIGFLNNGDLLMYQERNAIISYDIRDFRYFKIRQTSSKFQAFAHVPSFVSLKEIMGDDTPVLNVRSSLTNDGPPKMKAERLLLVEENREIMSGSDTPSDNEYDD